VYRLLLIALVGALAAPSSAQIAEFDRTAEYESDVENAFEEYERHLWAKRFDLALAAVDRIKPGNSVGRAIVASMKASALLGLDRQQEALAHIAEAEELAPQNPYPSFNLFNGALAARKFDVAADTLDRMIARFPDVVREIDNDLLYHFRQNVPKGQSDRNDDRVIALARLGYGGDSVIGDSLAEEAIEIIAIRGQGDSVGDLLRYIDDPQSVQALLAQRKYSAIWPELERRAGRNLIHVRESSVRSAEEAYAADPSDANLSMLARAYRVSRRHRDALNLRDRLPRTAVSTQSMTEDMGWAMQQVAQALYGVGRKTESNSLMASFIDAPIEKGGWRVSMLLNWLGRMIYDGEFEKVMLRMSSAEEYAQKEGNSRARQIVRQWKYCALMGLQRNDAAAPVLEELLLHAADSYVVTVNALLCGSQFEKAEELALRAMKLPENERDFVGSLGKPGVNDPPPSVQDKRWLELRARPRIDAEFNRLGRDLPEEFEMPPVEKMS